MTLVICEVCRILKTRDHVFQPIAVAPFQEWDCTAHVCLHIVVHYQSHGAAVMGRIYYVVSELYFEVDGAAGGAH